jgi:hypothetical protein
MGGTTADRSAASFDAVFDQARRLRARLSPEVHPPGGSDQYPYGRPLAYQESTACRIVAIICPVLTDNDVRSRMVSRREFLKCCGSIAAGYWGSLVFWIDRSHQLLLQFDPGSDGHLGAAVAPLGRLGERRGIEGWRSSGSPGSKLLWHGGNTVRRDHSFRRASLVGEQPQASGLRARVPSSHGEL